MSASPPSETILEMHGIDKRFPGVLALDRVDLDVKRGEIHALIGQNGAGKSTLMKILAGVYAPDEGEIRIDGRAVEFHHPRDALRQGIGTVYQELSLAPNLSVADNIFLGREPGNGFVIDQSTALKRAAQVLGHLGVKHINPRARVGTLPLVQQQLVEIAKVLSYEPRILILDEPTAPLADEETTHLFSLLNGLKQKGIAIIFISHRFKEIIERCDRGTILRNGKLVKTLVLKDITENDLVEMMIGQELESFFRHEGTTEQGAGDVELEVENLSVGRKIRDVSFELRRGEIVGMTGLLGAGQNEVARALFGIMNNVRGTIRRKGKVVTIDRPDDAIQLGICLLTEHRKLEGLVLDMNVKENITLPSLFMFAPGGIVDNAREEKTANEFIQRLNVVVRSARSKMGTLSGGNQQKTILARWLLRNLDILIFIEPTRGIDVGAKAEIYQDLDRLARQGKSILVISPDLLEILGISDRIFVMYNGRLTHVLNKGQVTEESLLAAIQGGSANGKPGEPTRAHGG